LIGLSDLGFIASFFNSKQSDCKGSKNIRLLFQSKIGFEGWLKSDIVELRILHKKIW